MTKAVWWMLGSAMTVASVSAFGLWIATSESSDDPTNAASTDSDFTYSAVPEATGSLEFGEPSRPSVATEPNSPTPETADPDTQQGYNALDAVDDRFATPAVVGAIQQTYTSSLSWGNAEADNLQPLIGDPITVSFVDGLTFETTLKVVTPGPVDPDRPKLLPRRRSVSAELTARPEVLATLTDYGAREAIIFHPEIGRANVMFGVYPTETGDKILEFILN